MFNRLQYTAGSGQDHNPIPDNYEKEIRVKIKERIIPYKGKNILIYFSVDRCTHVAECLRGAPEVFDSTRRPWIIADAEGADKVAEVIVRCPTGALHFKRLDGGPVESLPEENILSLEPNGPVYFKGNIELRSGTGEILLRDTRIAMCRCGQSRHRPFCDGLHAISDFQHDGSIRRKKRKESEELSGSGPLTVTFQTDGPILLEGPFKIIDPEGRVGFQGNRAVLCRCGASKKPPFCDNSHSRTGFQAES